MRTAQEPFDSTAPLAPGTTVLEASAGTGKTYTIASLVVRLVAAEDVPLDRILVVTFTEAATAELRDRIRARLAAARTAFRDRDPRGDALLTRLLQDEEVVRAAPARLDAALAGFDEATIATIHGFCHRVLSEQAFESGVTYDTELLTDLRPLLADVVQDVWTEETYDAAPCWLDELSTMKPDSLERFAQLVCRARDARIVPESASLEEIEARWRGIVDAIRGLGADGHAAALALVQEAVDGEGMHKSQFARPFAERRAELEEWLARDEPVAFDAPPSVEKFAQSYITAKTNKGWTKTRPAPAHRLFERLGELAGLRGDALLAFRRRLVDRIRERVEERKGTRGVWSFDDLLERLRDALRGEGGAALAAGLRERYRAVLIDEFQDTDAVQWDIFYEVFPADGGWLCLIGDPKQAIYRFRGADIETYFHARDSASRRATLPRNWRSDPRYVRAVNAVFDRPEPATPPFLDERIGFDPVTAEKDDRLRFAGAPGPALRFIVRPSGEDGTTGKGDFEADLPARVAAEIVHLLNDAGVTIAPETGDESAPPSPAEPLAPKHLAVLTRTNAQARDVQKELRRRRVPSILHGDASVYSTAEATDLHRVLEAVLDPSRETKVKAALATDLLGMGATELDHLATERDDDWIRLLDGLRDLRRRWEERGFVAMLHQLFQSRGVVVRVLEVVGGERRMTNVVHLVELLHRASREERLGPAALVRWLERQIRREEDGGYTDREAAQIRLESDAAAVQIATVHRSKGLEYPVVFAPWLWKGKRPPKDWYLEVRDPADGRRVIDLRGAKDGEAAARAHRDEREEELRLAYVALTRARHLGVVHHGLVNELDLSPLGHLLHDGAKVDDGALRRDLDALVARAEGTIDVVDDRPPSGASYVGPPADAASLEAASLGRRLDRLFRTSSFSALVSGHAGAAGSPTETGAEQDDPALEPTRAATDGARVPLEEFVRGTRAGRFLHRVLEEADFRVEARAALQDEVDAVRRYYAIPASFPSSAIADALGCALDAPLDAGPDGAGVRLSDVPPERRWNELPFLFPVASDGAPLRPSDLARVIREEGPPAVAGDVADRIEALGFAPLRGFLRGFIDLVFRDGPGDDARFWVVDFKSNDLGPRYGDYETDALRRAMREHDYDLQALLYLVAVHRFLRLRLVGYDPARHLGGARYLFLRGMSAGHPGRGVMELAPSVALVERLDGVLGHVGGDA